MLVKTHLMAMYNSFLTNTGLQVQQSCGFLISFTSEIKHAVSAEKSSIMTFRVYRIICGVTGFYYANFKVLQTGSTETQLYKFK